jgi:hypothetical protein
MRSILSLFVLALVGECSEVTMKDPKPGEKESGISKCRYFGYDCIVLPLNGIAVVSTLRVPVFTGKRNWMGDKNITVPNKINFRRMGEDCGDVVVRTTIDGKEYLIDVLMSVEQPTWGSTRGLLNSKGHCSPRRNFLGVDIVKAEDLGDSRTVDGVVSRLVGKSVDSFPAQGTVQKLIPHMVVVSDLTPPQDVKKKSSSGNGLAGVLRALGPILDLIVPRR